MNVYYRPEEAGLEILYEDDQGGSHEFEKFVVWRDLTTGNLYYAIDEGCSCPEPFEWASSTDDLEKVGPLQVIDKYRLWLAENHFDGDAQPLRAALEESK